MKERVLVDARDVSNRVDIWIFGSFDEKYRRDLKRFLDARHTHPNAVKRFLEFVEKDRRSITGVCAPSQFSGEEYEKSISCDRISDL